MLDTKPEVNMQWLADLFGEGNDSPLWWSCLENPRDRGAWWAAVYGVAQSRTRLKWLSSSSGPMENCIFRKTKRILQPHDNDTVSGFWCDELFNALFHREILEIAFPEGAWGLSTCAFVLYCLAWKSPKHSPPSILFIRFNAPRTLPSVP